MIRIVNVKKSFRDHTVLDGINLELPDTGLVLIKGVNGSGKTTLLNLIGGLDIPDTGYLEVDGLKLPTSEKELGRYREKKISFIFQENNLFDNLTVLENINIANGSDENFESIYKTLRLSDLLNKKCKDLSGGEKTRVTIARAIIKSSPIILADEPTASIDPESKHEILALLKNLSETRLVILVSHNADDSDYVDMLCELDHGVITNIKKRITRPKSIQPAFSLKEKNFKRKFEPLKFAQKNLFVEKKQIARNSSLLLISFLLVLLSLIIINLDFKNLLITTLQMENEDTLVVDIDSHPDKDEIVEFENKFPTHKFYPGYTVKLKDEYDYRSITFDIDYRENEVPYYNKSFKTLYFYSSELINPDIGRSPIAKNEIVISSYLADYMIKFGLKEGNDSFIPKDYETLITSKHSLKLGGNDVFVVGIYTLDLSKFERLKTEQNRYLSDLLSEILKYKASNIYVQDDFYSMFENTKEIDYERYSFTKKEYPEDASSLNMYHASNYKIFDNPVELLTGEVIEELHSGEIIINETILKDYNLDYQNCLGQEIKIYIRKNEGTKKVTPGIIGKVVGISTDDDVYINETDAKDYLRVNTNLARLVTNETAKKNLEHLFSSFPVSLNGKDVYLETIYTTKIDDIKSGYEGLALLIFLGAIVLSILSIIFMTNYILDLIDQKKKDIAILKSLGIDDLKIMSSFFSGTLRMILKSFLYSLIAFILVRFIINLAFSHIMCFKIDLVNVDISLTLLVLFASIILNFLISVLIYIKIQKINPSTFLTKTNI